MQITALYKFTEFKKMQDINKSEFNVFIYHDIKSWFLLFSILTETELIGPTVSRP